MDTQASRLNHVEDDYRLPNRSRYIPYISRKVFELPYIQYLSHTVTPLTPSELDICDGRYSQSFVIEDYDYSKDYHLNIEGLTQNCDIYINDNKIAAAHKDTLKTHIEFDVTHAVHAGENHLSIIMTPTKTLPTSKFVKTQDIFQEVYVLERANDRIVDYALDVSHNTRGDLRIRLQITDIEGAPMISYILQNAQKLVCSKGEVNIDGCHHLLIPTHLSGQQEGYFILFLETDDETIAHYIEPSGRHAPVNVKFHTIFEKSQCL